MTLTDKRKSEIREEEKYRSFAKDQLRAEFKPKNPGLALVMSLIVPGLGQIYVGKFWRGVLIFIFSWTIIVWLFGIIDAYKQALFANNPENFTEDSIKKSIENNARFAKMIKNLMLFFIIFALFLIFLSLVISK